MKIIRTITYFIKKQNFLADKDMANKIIDHLNELTNRFEQSGYIVQTRRVCIEGLKMHTINRSFSRDPNLFLSVGRTSLLELSKQLNEFASNPNLFCNIDLTNMSVSYRHIELLFALIEKYPLKTFNFCFTFNNAEFGAYFPMSVPGIIPDKRSYFVIGLQPTSLSGNCLTIDEWLAEMSITWSEIEKILKEEKDFLGIDSSIAPLGSKEGSFIDIIRTRQKQSFSHSVSTPIYNKISWWIKQKNPKKIGLCGLMFPCLEDWGLRDEYEKENFSIERNLFLSLHSGTGIDTYPIGINESKNRIIEILELTQFLSTKFNKPLSVRFVSDGISKIGERTRFQEHNFLTNSIIQKL